MFVRDEEFVTKGIDAILFETLVALTERKTLVHDSILESAVAVGGARGTVKQIKPCKLVVASHSGGNLKTVRLDPDTFRLSDLLHGETTNRKKGTSSSAKRRSTLTIVPTLHP